MRVIGIWGIAALLVTTALVDNNLPVISLIALSA